MKIEHIGLRNYGVFREAKLSRLPAMTIIIGTTGTGKSTLFDVFSFLKDSLAGNVASAVARRGGFRELASRDQAGPVSITIKFRESGGSLASYILKVALKQGRVVVAREALRYRRGRGSGRPWHFIDFSEGRGTAITNESVYGEAGAIEERNEFVLDDPSLLAIKGLGQFRDFRVVSEFRSLIENWHISNFLIAEARPSAEAGFAEHLSTRGDNIAQVAQYLYEHYPERFENILASMRWRVPGVTGIEAKLTVDGRLALRFQDGTFKDPFLARHVSDGTIKMFAYLVLLNDPKPHPLLAVEEPENHLYPAWLGELCEEFRAYARRGGHVFTSTHSPDFLNGAELGEVYWLEKANGFSTIHRARDKELLKRFVNDGDHIGDLWRCRLLGNVDSR